MSITEQNIEYGHELNSAFTRAGLNDAVRFSRGEVDIEPQEIALSLDADSVVRGFIHSMDALGPYLQMLTKNEETPASDTLALDTIRFA